MAEKGVLVKVTRLTGNTAAAAARLQLLEKFGQVAGREEVLVQNPQTFLILA